MNRRLCSKSGFTLLEIIIVIIIIAILASLALPRFLRTSQYSYAAEALSNLSALRQSMNRCYLFANTYTGCDALNKLDVGDPAADPGHHFTYTDPAVTATTFNIKATGIPPEVPSAASITIYEDGHKVGTDIFGAVR